jgi:beta-lactamase class A
MPHSAQDPPLWPGPGYEQGNTRQRQPRNAYRDAGPTPYQAAGPVRAPQGPLRQPGPPPSLRRQTRRSGRGPIVIVILLVALLGVTALSFLAIRLHNAGALGGTPSTDALSPELGAYVATQGGDMGVAVYDVTHDRAYASNGDETYILASSTKVYLMLADLNRIEAAERKPSANDVALLTGMIEHSDNDDAQAIYQQIGFATGMQRYLNSIGITDYVPCDDGWGCAKASAADMVHALTLLQKGQILTADDRQLALNLMKQVEADQRMGVGETAPDGATYYMKDGWLNYPDPKVWNLNSSGIVVTDKVTYIISVYSQNQPGEDWSKVDRVCALVAKALALSSASSS